jgi:hypothetical protein
MCYFVPVHVEDVLLSLYGLSCRLHEGSMEVRSGSEELFSHDNGGPASTALMTWTKSVTAITHFSSYKECPPVCVDYALRSMEIGFFNPPWMPLANCPSWMKLVRRASASKTPETRCWNWRRMIFEQSSATRRQL